MLFLFYLLLITPLQRDGLQTLKQVVKFGMRGQALLSHLNGLAPA